MTTREQILQYWREKLDESRRRARAAHSPLGWQYELYAKVLGYLVSRYADPLSWSSEGSGPSLPPGDLVERPATERVPLVFRPPAGAGTPPKRTAAIRWFLDDIHRNNAGSYAEFGLASRYESN